MLNVITIMVVTKRSYRIYTKENKKLKYLTKKKNQPNTLEENNVENVKQKDIKYTENK